MSVLLVKVHRDHAAYKLCATNTAAVEVRLKCVLYLVQLEIFNIAIAVLYVPQCAVVTKGRQPTNNQSSHTALLYRVMQTQMETEQDRTGQNRTKQTREDSQK